jgi:hypothetical protein
MSDVSAIPLLREQKRWFTPNEANALLPYLLPMIDELITRVERAQGVASLLQNSTETSQQWAVARDLEELQQAARDTLSGIEAHGVEIKGVRPALLDFPALKHGQEVCLCWSEGEELVAWWHPLHTGIKGREPIDANALAAFEYWT